VKAFLDTSVMVAAFWGDHPSHEPSLDLFAGANRQTTSCGLHSLSEVYATMSALPVRPALAPEQAFLFVQQMTEKLATIALEQSEYLNAIRDLADRSQTGGRVYDALLLACARKVRAETIYTLNLKHFRQLAPDLAGRIRAPGE
jgi:predicted nucleic acid-binding protein